MKEGYNVVFCGRSVERGEEVAKETGALFIKCDVSIPEEPRKMIAEIKEKFGSGVSKKFPFIINNLL